MEISRLDDVFYSQETILEFTQWDLMDLQFCIADFSVYKINVRSMKSRFLFICLALDFGSLPSVQFPDI